MPSGHPLGVVMAFELAGTAAAGSVGVAEVSGIAGLGSGACWPASEQPASATHIRAVRSRITVEKVPGPE
jgi:hypothetical protein